MTRGIGRKQVLLTSMAVRPTKSSFFLVKPKPLEVPKNSCRVT